MPNHAKPNHPEHDTGGEGEQQKDERNQRRQPARTAEPTPRPRQDQGAARPHDRPEHSDAPHEPTPPHSRVDEAADTEGKDAVQLGSEGSFPASDPPSWMDRATPGGRPADASPAERLAPESRREPEE